MARTPAGLPAGIRVSDHISLGVIARAFPPDPVREVLAEAGRASAPERDLPAQVMVYDAIALALYMGAGTREVLRCLLEGLRWLWGAEAVRIAGKSGISQARTRLGAAPLHRLYERVVRPIATPATKGALRRLVAAVPSGSGSMVFWTLPSNLHVKLVAPRLCAGGAQQRAMLYKGASVMATGTSRSWP